MISSAVKSGLGVLFLSSINIVPKQNTLIDLDHQQPSTLVKIDNTTALGVVTNILKRKRTKVMDIRFYWVRDRMIQRQHSFYFIQRYAHMISQSS